MYTKKLKAIDARIISPFNEFVYETKNEGFIKISEQANLQIKVKNILYNILQNGTILQLKNRSFSLQ